MQANDFPLPGRGGFSLKPCFAGLHDIHLDFDCTGCHAEVGDAPLASTCASCHPADDPGKCMLARHHEYSVDYEPTDPPCLSCHVECTEEEPPDNSSNECPVVELYGEQSEKTKSLRHFRDKALSKITAGREVIRRYYRWAPAILKQWKRMPVSGKE